MKKLFVPVVMAISLWMTGCQQRSPVVVDPAYQPKEGDVIFQSLPHNPIIDAIEGSTHSTFSHCGILHHNGKCWVVIEAIGPVRETPLPNWIGQSRDQQFSVFRLKKSYEPKMPEFIQAAKAYKGLPYDIHYDLDDGAIYCSELIYKAFRKATGESLGQLQRLGDLDWQPHEAVIKAIEGGNLPLERKMITPRSLSKAAQLQKVYP